MTVPETPSALLDGWSEVEREHETVFDIKLISVEADTVVYQDASLARRYDAMLRFFFATRLQLNPAVNHSGPLRQLLRERADAGFREELRKRGFENLSRLGTTDIEHEEAHRATRVVRYEATVPTGSMTVSAIGVAGVWEGDKGEFGFAGGAYPTAVNGSTPDWLNEQAMEDELLQLISETRV